MYFGLWLFNAHSGMEKNFRGFIFMGNKEILRLVFQIASFENYKREEWLFCDESRQSG